MDMEAEFMDASPEYCVPYPQYMEYPDIERYAFDENSTDSSPSPTMLFTELDGYQQELLPSPIDDRHNLDRQSTALSVEFTDLTVPYQEDRRRRRSNVIRDKQTISSMHMRRRAQNRASQRAFRERKERHTQDLQKQLDELEKKHHDLLSSYDVLGSTNNKLKREVEQLRGKIKSSRSLKTEDFDDCPASESIIPGADWETELRSGF
ncbi:hypothetical protein MMC09_007018 [Bachmanniomyces sp. S44760]|nr:hypothetical protein [Bachmanniomyces sp. S44760]